VRINTLRPRRVLALLVGLLVLSAYGLAESKSQPAAGATQQVRAVLDMQVAAWNNGDLQRFMEGYWKSPELTFFSGATITKGWQATLERYQKRYQAEGREMGKLTFSDLDIELAGPDSAWVRGRWQVVTSKEKLGGLFTLLVKKRPEGWRIVHDHTSQG
jgi:beta-aspartyl-peptidase (threonine type)